MRASTGTCKRLSVLSLLERILLFAMTAGLACPLPYPSPPHALNRSCSSPAPTLPAQPLALPRLCARLQRVSELAQTTKRE